MSDLWNELRYLNQYVAVIAAIGVTYRLTIMAADRTRWGDPQALHLMLWFIYIAVALFLAAFGAAYYSQGPTPANWTSGARFFLHFVAIGLSIWWPHPRVFRKVESSDAGQ